MAWEKAETLKRGEKQKLREQKAERGKVESGEQKVEMGWSVGRGRWIGEGKPGPEDFQAGGGGILLSRRTTTSCGGQEAALAVGGIGEASEDVLLGEFRVVGDDGLMGHPSGEPAQNVTFLSPSCVTKTNTASPGAPWNWTV